jgi:hypothetical protein
MNEQTETVDQIETIEDREDEIEAAVLDAPDHVEEAQRAMSAMIRENVIAEQKLKQQEEEIAEKRRVRDEVIARALPAQKTGKHADAHKGEGVSRSKRRAARKTSAKSAARNRR